MLSTVLLFQLLDQTPTRLSQASSRDHRHVAQFAQVSWPRYEGKPLLLPSVCLNEWHIGSKICCAGTIHLWRIWLNFIWLHDTPSTYRPHDIFFLFHQCLWKVVRSLPKTISDVKVDQILLDIHTFLLTHPDQMWKNRADDTPLRTIKTVLYTLGKLKKQEVSRNDRDLISLLKKIHCQTNG